MKVAISGASGKTGYRVVEEAISAGYSTRLILRENSSLPENLKGQEIYRLNLSDKEALDNALNGCDALVIATGARPSVDLTGPARVDAIGVKNQVESCITSGVKRVLLVSSLCAGRWIHPLNFFGLILVWKKIGEKQLENSGLDWTIIRPGGLKEDEENLDKEYTYYSGPDIQEDASIPRRLVAKSCIDALRTPSSIGKIIEVTSSPTNEPISMEKAIKGFTIENT